MPETGGGWYERMRGSRISMSRACASSNKVAKGRIVRQLPVLTLPRAREANKRMNSDVRISMEMDLMADIPADMFRVKVEANLI